MLGRDYAKVLTVDLTKEKIKIDNRKDLAQWLGGVGLATKLLEEQVLPEADPFDPDQPVVLAIGPMSTIFPVVTKVVAMFKSPLTNELGESYAGMRLAMSMRFAGYDAIVIKGKAAKPVYLSVDARGVRFKNAAGLWGLSIEDSGRLLRQMENGSGHRSCLRIGPAGEKGVTFAGVNVDTYRHFGRLGMGAVLGQKNLKAMVVIGDREIPIANPKEYVKVYGEIYQHVVHTEVMEKYHALGTAVNVEPLSEMQSLPTRNLQSSTFEQVKGISGEAFAEESLIRKMACSGCPVGCIHIGMYRRQFDEGYEYESTGVSYDYELIYALGSLLGMGEPNKIYPLIELVEHLGLDVISTGVQLAWLTEALDHGLITSEQVGTNLRFGEPEGYLKAIDNLVKQPTQLYQDLAKGTKYAAEKHGGLDFALIAGGHEIAGYHTGYGSLLGQMVGARHSHLDNGGYSFDQSKQVLKGEEMVDALLKEEMERCVLNSLCICLFARKVYSLPVVSQALHSIGINLSEEDLTKLGKEIYLAKLRLKTKMNFDASKEPIPRRFFETPSLNGVLQRSELEDLVDIYQQKVASLSQ